MFETLAAAAEAGPRSAHPVPEPLPQARRIEPALDLLERFVPLRRQLMHTGSVAYQLGDRFHSLHIVHSGFFKLVSLNASGHEQVVALHLKGDWLGFDGIATGRHGCNAVALDVGEIWTVTYLALQSACAVHPPLLTLLHAAMCRDAGRGRDWLMAQRTLSADARVADFLHGWAELLAERGLRTDQVSLRMTRAEIGNYLGMAMETVSRALSALARERLISFVERHRREIRIRDVGALGRFVQRSLAVRDASTH